MGTTSNSVEAIDLTLTSSPEPEPRSQQRQSHTQSHIKRESRPYHMGSRESRAGHRGSASRFNVPHESSHSVNPQHLRQIVYTSDEHALRKVLIHLCQMSPALSGAVARGLAPHSTFARQVVNRRRNEAAAALKLEDDSDDSAYERTKKRLATMTSGSKSSARQPSTPSEYLSARRESQAAPSRSSIPRVKIETGHRPGPSGTDSDEIHIPGSYPRGMTRVTSVASPSQNMPRAPLSANRTPNSSLPSTRPANPHRQLPTKPTCINCRLSFTPGFDEVCVFHPGQKVRREGQGVFNCCDAPVGDPGCQFGCHESAEDLPQAANDRKRPSASPHPPGTERKRARKF